jgi:hypothetical protein
MVMSYKRLKFTAKAGGSPLVDELHRRGVGFTLVKLLLTVLLGSWFQITTLAGDSSALIVTGLSPSADDAAKFLLLATETKRLLVERGLPESRVEILHEKVTRGLVLQKLQAVTAGTNDEFWLVLYGLGGRSRGNQPAFQVGGPRLTAADLKAALDAIPARQFVFIGTGDSGGFLPVLQADRRMVLSATREEGEPDQPRFPDAWLKTFSENPKASFEVIAAQAAAAVDAEYTKSHLAQSEHSRLADPMTSKILEPPFEVNLEATNSPPTTDLKAK